MFVLAQPGHSLHRRRFVEPMAARVTRGLQERVDWKAEQTMPA
jgi:hypothetical protein